MIIRTFILDFQTTNFEADAKIALEMLSDYQKLCSLENSYALDPPIQSLGWWFAKMFLAGQLVEKIYRQQGHRIDSFKGKKIEDKFISWLQNELKDRGCSAYVKMAPEMKST